MEMQILMNIDSFHSKRLTYEASQGFIDDHNDIIFEEDKTEVVFFEEQKQRDILRMFNSTKFKNVQQMYDSRALKWSNKQNCKDIWILQIKSWFSSWSKTLISSKYKEDVKKTSA